MSTATIITIFVVMFIAASVITGLVLWTNKTMQDAEKDGRLHNDIWN